MPRRAPARSVQAAPRARAPGREAELEALLAARDQQVAALERENVGLRRARDDSLEEQTATADVLRVISRSVTDLEGVFDQICRSAGRLCGAAGAQLQRTDGEMKWAAGVWARAGWDLPDLLAERTLRFDRLRSTDEPGSVTNEVIRSKQAHHIHDLWGPEGDPYAAGTQAFARRTGVRTHLSIPLLRDDRVLGVLSLYHTEVRPFTDQQVRLLHTFADQAVIAIENARLFSELNESNAGLREALEQQTATAEVLAAISRSPTDLQSVLDTIARSAARFCGAPDAVVQRLGDGRLVAVAHHGDLPLSNLGVAIELSRAFVGGRAVLDRRTVWTADYLAESPEEYAVGRALAAQHGVRRSLAAPLLRGSEAVGTLLLRRREPGPFLPAQVALAETFADQAVIAIENARLFQELQERLEEQTVTGEVLRVISRSPTDLQAVLDAIVRGAARLCASDGGAVFRVEGDTFRSVARLVGGVSLGAPGEANPLSREDGLTGRAMVDREVVHVHDLAAVPIDQAPAPYPRSRGIRTMLCVPLLGQGTGVGAIGALTVSRREVRSYTEREIALVKTFADQAVIAIENARLFSELQERTGELQLSVERLTALFEVSGAVSATLDLDRVLETVVARAAELAGADGGAIYAYDAASGLFALRATHRMSAEVVAAIRGTPIRVGETPVGRAAAMRAPIQVPDLLAEAEETPARRALERAGYRALLSVPLLREQEIVGALVVRRKSPGAFADDTVALLQTFANQSALAIQNARLFRELADKSRQLEEASRHKSEFLANMSHELRTPLNAIIGFTEVLLERYFGEINEKQEDYLKDVLSSGQHLLSLINDILDLSKVEAGRMELELGTFDLGPVLEAGLVMVRERASRGGVALSLAVADDLGRVEADERKVKQVLFNLLTNAVKFTPEGGAVTVSARRADGWIEVAVQDTGVGIAPEEQGRVFEEFGQARGASGQSEGTGLGLTLCRRFVELHGGTIGVASEPGRGSTFTVSLPVRQPTPPAGPPGQP